MSTTIDERVVAMRFDSAQFEKRVQSTMSILDKFKQKLNFSGASKGLEGINRAAKGVNLNGLGSAAETVGLKFNAMYTMADQALRNITNRVQHTAESMIKAFTIDPIKTGFQEYETQINAVQTILANTQSKGTDLGQVNAALDELNKYADQTIYNFTEMTRNIGTFTAAGVDLDMSVQSIKGIANLAAVSGSTSQQASTVMYQLSQALAAGKVSLMDWNSVVNAGMGGEVFQNALIRTSELLGTGAKAAIDTYGTFRESLTQGEWLTKEVLTETLAQISGAYTEADLLAQGYSKAQVNEILQLADTAVQAATKVKTFTQLLDTLKESAQSGWTQTWELFFGDFEQAKEMWTGVSETLGGLIESMSESRNSVLEPMLMSNWDQLVKRVNEAGISTEDFNEQLEKTIKKGGASDEWLEKTVKKYGSLQKAFQAGAIDSKWLSQTVDELNKNLGKLKDVEVGLKMGDTGDDVKQVQQALENLGYSLEKYGVDGIIGSETEAAIKAFQKAEGLEVTGIIDQPTLDALKEAGTLTGKLIEGVDGFIKNIDQLKGREKIIQSFKNVWSFLSKIVAPIKEAFKDVFPESLWTGVGKAIDGIYNFTESLSLSEGTIENIKDTFHGLFSVVSIIAKIIGGGLKIAFKIATKAASFLATNILRITSIFGKMAYGIKNGLDGITSFADISSETIAGIVEPLKAGASQVWDALVSIVQKIIDFIVLVCTTLGIASPSKVMYDIAVFLIEGFVNGVKFAINKIAGATGLLSDKIGGFFDGIDWEGMKNAILDKFNKVVTFIKGFDWSKLLALIPATVVGVIVKKIWDFVSALTKGVAGFGDILDTINDVIGGFADTGKNFQKVIKSFALSVKADALKNIAIAIAILVGSVIALTFVDQEKLYGAVGIVLALSVILGVLAFAMDKMSSTALKFEKGKGLSMEGFKQSLVGIGIALLLLAVTVKMIGKMSPEQAIGGFIGLAALMGAMLIFVKICGKFGEGGALKDVDKVGKLMKKLAIAMMLMIVVIKLIGWLDVEDALKGVAFAAAFAIFVRSITAVAKDSGNNVSKVGGLMVKLAIAMGLMIGVVKLAGTLSLEEMLKGAAFAAGFVIFVKSLVATTKISKGQEMAKVGRIVLSMSLALALMVGVCKLVNLLSVGEMLKGALFAAGFTVLVKTMVGILKIGNEQKMAKVSATILAMSVGIGIMAGIAILLSFVPLEGLAKGVIAVGLLGLVMAAMVKATSGASDVKGNFIGMAVAIGVMAVAVAGLSMIDGKKLAGATTCLATLMGMFALMAKMAGTTGKAVGTILVLGLVVAGLAGVLALLAKNDATASIKSAVAIGILVMAMASSLEVLDGVKMVSKNAMIAMGIMVAVVALLGVVMGLLKKFDLNASIGTATALSILLIGMSAACLILSAIGPAAINAVAGAAALAGVILVLGGLIVALGELVSEIPQMETFLNKGIPVLEKIGVGIGKFVGGIVGGIGEGIADSLPNISTKLTEFINNFSSVDSTAIENAKSLASGMASIAWSSLGTSIAEFLNFNKDGGSLFEQFGTNGEELFKAMRKVFLQAAVVTYDEKTKAGFDAVITAAEKLAGVQESLTGLGNFIDWIVGRDKLTEFGESCKSFFGSMKTGLSELTDLTVNKEALKAVIIAAEELAGLESSLTQIDSVIGWFASLTGDQNNLKTFGENVKSFIGSMKTALGYGKDGTGLGKFTYNKDSFKGIMDAATDLAGLESSLTQIDSVIKWFASLTGDQNNLVTFGDNIKAFISSMKSALGYNADGTGLGGFTYDAESFKGLMSAATELASLEGSLEQIDSVMEWFVGKQNLGTFGTNVGIFADGMAKLKTALAGGENGEGVFTQTAVDSMTYAANALIALDKGLPEKGFFDNKEDLGDFSSHITNFATALSLFSQTCSEIDKEAVDVAVNAAGRIRSLINTLADMDTSGVEAFTGVGSGGLGADGLMFDIACAIADFSDKVKNIDIAAVDTSVSAATKLRNLINNLADTDISGLENFKIDGIGDAIKGYASSVADIDTTVVSSSVSIANRLKNFINSLANIDTSGVGSFKTAISDLSTISVGDIAKSFSGAASKLVEIGGSLMTSLSRGMKSKEAAINQTASSIAIKTYSAVVKKAEIYKAAGVKLMDALIVGLKSKASSISTTVNTSISAAIVKINGKYTAFYNAGKFLGSGLVLGINAKQQAVYDAAYALGQKAVEGEKDGQESQSPSKATKRAGKWFGEGLIIGIDSMSKQVYNAGSDLGKTGVRSISSAISKVSDLVTNGIDSQPTIRPVLDLSDVEAGAGSINGMFGNGLNLGVSTAAAGNVAGFMNNRIQNGTTNDVISAIDKLRKDLGNVGGNSYSINGITYDDGSNVANAVNALIRAAKIDRRI